MIEVYGKTGCSFCERAIALLESKGIDYKKYTLLEDISVEEFHKKFPDARTVPMISRGDEIIGNYNALVEYLKED
jgi:glutaredoxin 3